MSDELKPLSEIQAILWKAFPQEGWTLQTEIIFHGPRIRFQMQLFAWPGSNGDHYSRVMFGNSLEQCIVRIKSWLAEQRALESNSGATKEVE